MYKVFPPSRIALKLIRLLIVFSSLITLITTGIQLWSEYGRDVSSIEFHFEQVERGYLESVAENVWQSDTERLNLLIKGIIESPDFKFARVRKEDGAVLTSAGIETQDTVIRKFFPLTYNYRDKNINIGELEVVASLAQVHDRTLDRFGLILLSNALRTFMVALFMFAVIHVLLTRHLDKMAQYAYKIDLGLPQEPLRLERSFLSNKPDEVDQLADSLNVMHDQLRKAHDTLKEQVIDRKEAAEASQAANRAKSAFLANMSHELRTPLNAILGFSEMLKLEIYGKHSDPHYNDYANTIHISGSHLLNIINDILDISRIEAGKTILEDIDLNIDDAINACTLMVSTKAEEAGVKIHYSKADAAYLLRADLRLFKQALINLLSNAIKFTPSGGRVTVSWQLGPSGGHEFRVTDTGIGISAEDIPKILEPFGQVADSQTRNHDGTGLGLPICKSLIELHDGTLTMESEPGKGTTVTIKFPPKRTIQNS